VYIIFLKGVKAAIENVIDRNYCRDEYDNCDCCSCCTIL